MGKNHDFIVCWVEPGFLKGPTCLEMLALLALDHLYCRSVCFCYYFWQFWTENHFILRMSCQLVGLWQLLVFFKVMS